MAAQLNALSERRRFYHVSPRPGRLVLPRTLGETVRKPGELTKF